MQVWKTPVGILASSFWLSPIASKDSEAFGLKYRAICASDGLEITQTVGFGSCRLTILLAIVGRASWFTSFVFG